MIDGPWNHNTAFHRELVRAVPGSDARVLDVGCGSGLLVARLAEVAGGVVGIDSDAAAIHAASRRLATTPNARVVRGDVLDPGALGASSFDLVVCVAALHHLPLREALTRMRDLVAVGGHLRIIGLAANAGVQDWIVSGLALVPIRVIDMLRHAASDARMVTATPVHPLATIRRAARELLPGSQVRRRFYHRFSLEWTKPSEPRRPPPSQGFPGAASTIERP